jgi:hypothetical protein
MRGRLTPSGARLHVDGIQEEISEWIDETSAGAAPMTGSSSPARGPEMRPSELLTPRDAADAIEPGISAVVRTDAATSTRTVASASASRLATDVTGLVDRLQLLRTVLAAMTDDLAQARREIRHLRRENARLEQRLTRDPVVPPRRR